MESIYQTCLSPSVLSSVTLCIHIFLAQSQPQVIKRNSAFRYPQPLIHFIHIKLFPFSRFFPLFMRSLVRRRR